MCEQQCPLLLLNRIYCLNRNDLISNTVDASNEENGWDSRRGSGIGSFWNCDLHGFEHGDFQVLRLKIARKPMRDSFLHIFFLATQQYLVEPEVCIRFHPFLCCLLCINIKYEIFAFSACYSMNQTSFRFITPYMLCTVLTKEFVYMHVQWLPRQK